MIQFGRKRQPVYQVLVPWIAILITMFVISDVAKRGRLPREWTTVIGEVVVFSLVFGLNRYWLKIKISLKSDLSMWMQVKTNAFPVIWMGLLLQGLIVGFPRGKSGSEIAMLILIALLVAIFEEYLFRGVLLNGFLERLRWRPETNLLWAVIFSSLLFASSHLINLTHQSLNMTIAQVMMAFGLGLMQSATYLRTRSLLWPIALHFVYDAQGLLRTGLMQTALNNIPAWSGVVSLVVYGIVAAVLLRPTKRAEVLAHFRL